MDEENTVSEANDVQNITEPRNESKSAHKCFSKEWFAEEAKLFPDMDINNEPIYSEFRRLYGPNVLQNLGGDDILNTIFFGTNDSNLCTAVYNDKRYLGAFGSIGKRQPYKYDIYYNKDKQWVTTYDDNLKSKGNLRFVTVDEALEYGKKVRDALVNGADAIEKWIKMMKGHFDETGYMELSNTLDKLPYSGLYSKAWVMKYFHMIFPDVFTNFYSDKYINQVLDKLGIEYKKKESRIIRMGKINSFRKKCETPECKISNLVFSNVYYHAPNTEKLEEPADEMDDQDDGDVHTSDIYDNPYNMPMNRIVFGAPGTGKSFYLDDQREALLGNDNKKNYERVTFYPDYSYANFIGTYKPVSEYETADMDGNVKNILSVIFDDEKKAQDKYDELYKFFSYSNKKAILAILLGIYTDDKFTEKRKKGEGTMDSNYSRNLGVSLRDFVELKDPADTRSGNIQYRFVPGPFMRVYVEAIKHPSKPYLLIIEEINRSNAAAVFGDVFQLLDRVNDDEDGSVGESRYPIQTSEDMKNFLTTQLGGKPSDYSEIRIPCNMFIWATMNSADQGVYPLDTAFKRRWDFKYIGIDDKEEELKDKNVRLGKGGEQIVEWNALRKAINKCLADNKINEDKQLGPFYINTKILDEVDSDTGRSEKFIAAFKDKVLMYLFEDAGRQIRSKLFKEGSRYSEICNDFDEKGIYVFSNIDHKGLIIKDETGPSGEEPSEGNS